MPPLKRRYGVRSSFYADRRSNAAHQIQSRWRSRVKRKRNTMVSVPRGKLGFPQSMRTTLKYCDKFDIDLPTLNCVVSTIRANSIYDPQYATGGHQPRGQDEFSDVYNDYCVTGCKLTATAMYQGYNGPVNYSISNVPPSGALLQSFPAAVQGNSSHASLPVGFIVQKSAEASGSATGNAETLEKKLEYDRSVSTFLNSQGQHKTLRTSMKIADMFGVKHGDLVGDQDYSGKTGDTATGSNPANVCYIHAIVGVAGHLGLTDPAKTGITMFVEVEYDVTFTNPKKLQAS